MAINPSRPSGYARAPYCFQTNYGSDSYSGPSTSFHPSFERNGVNYPPSHYDINQYCSPFASDPRLRCSSSISSVEWSNWKEKIPERPANLRSTYDSQFSPLSNMSTGEDDEDGGLKWSDFKIKNLISKTKSGIKDRYEKSFGNQPNHGNRGNQSWTAGMQARYFIAQIEKKLYDARVAAKKAVIKSGYALLRKPYPSRSQRWRDKLDKGYANYKPKKKKKKKGGL